MNRYMCAGIVYQIVHKLILLTLGFFKESRYFVNGSSNCAA